MTGHVVEPPWLLDTLAGVRAMGARLPHALLIHGPPGWGEERIANALALDLMRVEPPRDAREIAHPDLRWLQPEDGFIKVDGVRGIIEFLVQTPQVAGRKIAVLEDADRMNLFAANALLKSLEEPPPDSYVVLSTSAPERLLPTIRSRCQQLPVRRGTGEEIRGWLKAVGVDSASVEYWAVEYGGAPFAIAGAAERGQAPLWHSLEKAARSPASARAVADGFRQENLVELLERWLRITHWLLREPSSPACGTLLEFATETLAVRRAALVNTGLNRPMQLQRLLLMWAEVWPSGSIPQVPKAEL